ncbi:MAG TPA: ABC-F family ATP-binding cassette domain-containing protein [Leptospiraceae bacterium]|nr:ABC-F family ATP-binding cassette domain-containing protein [Leptospiraceae bacterium]HMW04704.1 ABC-F family ATP-binding cassette domain-containing protein [Leptospiraceae bacterium]HMX31735.1 ABC-F family ATP-binding cassette domain-containing protein [Leptospiraceae bacterium]HMY30541.1 ABC-F family ATP-binding cassette domain-containing protein [Leptospiraceae bacterium]HMZ64158.1 ABC-F family ATP-binding cassette domain-containing protein [Leptospiraceae bacterium]
MNLLSIDKISKSAGEKELFRDLTFGLNEGEKVAIIGVNGSGKSTFLKIIKGLEEVDGGAVYKNRNLKISSLEQNPSFNPEDTILEHIFKGKSKALSLIQKYEEISERITLESTKELESELHSIMNEIEKANAWEYENQIKSILNELGIKGLNRKMSELSGGMLKKVELVQTLIDESNLLILDEPTNHLDIDTILWLEEYLIKMNKSLLLVTHDRYFLDLVVDKILEISLPQSTLFEGNYNYYLEKKVEMDEANARKEAKAEGFLRVELEWLKRQPKARGTKQKARTDKIISVINREKFEEQEKFTFKVDPKKVGKKILEIENISKSFGPRNLIQKFSYTFKHYERLGIVGPNGSGKSTLLNILTGKLNPDSGFVNPGMNTRFGYFDQNSIELKQSMRVLEYIQKTAGEYIPMENGERISAGLLLERFQFPSKMQSSPVEKLSGGEKRRLYLVQILMHNPNFLILDEPTNDFDIKTLSILEEFLLEFPGCILTVSHDRYFMDRVANHLLVFDGMGNISGFAGTYSEYLSKPKKDLKEKSEPIQEKKQVEDNTNKPQKKKLSYKEEKELKTIESDIDSLEKEKTQIQSDLTTFHSDFVKVKSLSDRLAEIESLLESKLLRWEELSS